MMPGMVEYCPQDGHDKQSGPRSVAEDCGEFCHDLPLSRQGHPRSHRVVRHYPFRPEHFAVLHYVGPQQVDWGQQTGHTCWISP